MSTGYFARVVDGIVDAVIRAEPEFISSNPILFQDNWVEVPDMESYPAIGWTWNFEDGFTSPPSTESEV
jgi:phage tail protein X